MRDYSSAEAPLKVDVETVGDTTILHVAGQVNEMGSDALSSALDGVLDGQHSHIIFDLADVTFLSSTGLGQIMRAYRSVKGCGSVRIAGAQPLVAEVFSLTKLNKLLGMYETLEEALDEPDLKLEE